MMANASGTLERVPIKWLEPRDAERAASNDAPAKPAAPPLHAPAIVSPVRPPARRAGLVERLRDLGRRRTLAAGGEAAGARTAALDPLAIRQRLYGRGYIIPGDAAFVLGLVAPFGLGSASALLDLAAGLGGPARTIAQASHAKVTGLERDYDRAKLGNAMSAALGTGHLVKIQNCDPESLELDAARFDAALGREATYAIAEKERFLRVVGQSLRTRGQIVLTEFVLDRDAGARDALGAWQERQPRRPTLWTAAQYADCFRSFGYGIRHAEDISALYRRQIVGAWVGYMRAGEIKGLPEAQTEAVLAEAEASLRTVAALESGALKYYRFEAIAHYSFW
ncbi:MAG TPA: class I SAM-dependent methyltransferase [Stellaceae bacterium]|nr:class I SAM-dependent methyltransferase [Stellaceae bacterium]